MKLGTIFSASDKSLYDALNQRNVTNSDLKDLFLSRGIIVSSESNRKHLAAHFSRIFHDYYDYQTLAKLFGSSANREKIATVRLKTDATLSDFQNSAFELKSILEESGATVRVSTAQGNRLDLEVKYAKVHFNKSDFRQIVTKNATLSFFVENGDLIVHSPNSEEANEWIQDLTKSVIDKTGKEVMFDEIRLSPSMHSKIKTSFFKNLIKNINGFSLKDVSDVYVSKAKADSDNEEAGSTLIRIDKATLRGQGVLESEELKLLEEKNGFYVSKIVWTATPENITNPDLYEFEAQFSRPEECADFAYLPRGYYKYLQAGKHNNSRTGFNSSEEMKYGKLIELAARKVFSNMQGEKNE